MEKRKRKASKNISCIYISNIVSELFGRPQVIIEVQLVLTLAVADYSEVEVSDTTMLKRVVSAGNKII